MSDLDTRVSRSYWQASTRAYYPAEGDLRAAEFHALAWEATPAMVNLWRDSVLESTPDRIIRPESPLDQVMRYAREEGNARTTRASVGGLIADAFLLDWLGRARLPIDVLQARVPILGSPPKGYETVERVLRGQVDQITMLAAIGWDYAGAEADQSFIFTGPTSILVVGIGLRILGPSFRALSEYCELWTRQFLGLPPSE